MNELERVLYVEDDEDIRAVVTVALEVVGGLTVRVCASGEQAVEEAAGFAPDMIVLDVMMPGMDGPRTLQELRRQATLAAVPFVFVTAKVHPEEIARFRSLGASDVVAKPFDPMQLAAQLRAIWMNRDGGGAAA